MIFSLEGSNENYLLLTEQPKKFDADSPSTNVFFDDTNGQVFTVRSGGVTGVTVNSMDDTKCTSFRMEDRGPIISIKFSPDHNILAIQRNRENQNATVEFVNFKDLAPTNVEYTHTCKWKNAKILGFVWPKANEIAFITDHGVELLQVYPEKKQLKSLKNVSFSGAWFSWCSQSSIVLLAGNNGCLLQPFSLRSSSITKLQKIELENTRPVVERDVFVLRLCHATWCAVFRHATSASVSSPGPTEVWLMPVSGSGGSHHTHVLKTGLVGRFAVSVVDNLIIVHHQSTKTSQLFDIMEDSKLENNMAIHIPIVPGNTMKPAMNGDQCCPMYSVNWVVFQPDYIIDARLGFLWKVKLDLAGLAHSVPREELAKLTATLLRRASGKEVVLRILHQMAENAASYLVQLSDVFDVINAGAVARAQAQAACRAGGGAVAEGAGDREAITQQEVCARVLTPLAEHALAAPVATAFVCALARAGLAPTEAVSEACVRALVRRRRGGRLRALVRRGALPDSRALACRLLSLARFEPAGCQLALDMMRRQRALEDVAEVLLGGGEPVAAAGATRALESRAWAALPARKLLAAARLHHPRTFLALYHALRARNLRLRNDPAFTKAEQCDVYDEYYKELMAELDADSSHT